MELQHQNFVKFLKNLFIILVKLIGDINLKVINSFNDLIINKRTDYNNIRLDKLKEEDIILGKIVSWNIHNGYNFYNKDCLVDDILYLCSEKAEFYLFQEVFDKILIEKLIENLGVKGKENTFYYNGNLIICNNDNFKADVYKFGSWEGRDENNCIGINTKINNRDIFLLNVHLQSDITMYQQYRQCQELIEYLNQYENVVMLGDFNSPYLTPPINILKNNFRKIQNNNSTFPSVYPLLTLDYAWMSKNLKGIDSKLTTINNKLSDHNALSLELTTTSSSC